MGQTFRRQLLHRACKWRTLAYVRTTLSCTTSERFNRDTFEGDREVNMKRTIHTLFCNTTTFCALNALSCASFKCRYANTAQTGKLSVSCSYSWRCGQQKSCYRAQMKERPSYTAGLPMNGISPARRNSYTRSKRTHECNKRYAFTRNVKMGETDAS